MYLIEIVGRSLVVYVAVLAGLRLGGRRELGQLTPFDLVVILLVVILMVANAVQNAMVGSDTTLQGGLVSATTLLVVNAGVARLRLRSVRIRQLVEGLPIVLVQHGELVAANLHHVGITQEEVEAAVREHGAIGEVSQVELAVLETDGSVSVVPMSADVRRSQRRLRHRRQ